MKLQKRVKHETGITAQIVTSIGETYAVSFILILAKGRFVMKYCGI